MDPIGIAVILVAAFFFLIIGFIVLISFLGFMATVFGIGIELFDILIDPIYGLYLKLMGKERKKEQTSSDYSIEQGEEIE